ncbi:MAG: hypothetical protein ACRYGR_10405 [Janthinobacterium lividum]
MKNIQTKYIIALLAEHPTEYIEVAHRLFSTVQDQYITGPESLPHITLCQFYTDNPTLEKIKQDIKSLSIFPQPHFNGIHFIKDPLPNLWGAEISVARDPAFIKYQNQFVNILKKYHIHCINDVGDLYRPHLTLARINHVVLDNFTDHILKDTSFILSIGRAGDLGQFIEVIETIKK